MLSPAGAAGANVDGAGRNGTSGPLGVPFREEDSPSVESVEAAGSTLICGRSPPVEALRGADVPRAALGVTVEFGPKVSAIGRRPIKLSRAIHSRRDL